MLVLREPVTLTCKDGKDESGNSRPLTPDLWPALTDLFGEQGACYGCWCMYWPIGSAYRKKPHSENKAAFRRVVKQGPPPGLLAIDDDLPVGWCQLTPRDSLPWLDRTWRLKRVDAVPVWSISCFYVRKGYRRRGITSALIAAALRTAKLAGAPALEAYPLDARLTPSASGTGYVSTFARAGFRIVCRRTRLGRSCVVISDGLRSGPDKRRISNDADRVKSFSTNCIFFCCFRSSVSP